MCQTVYNTVEQDIQETQDNQVIITMLPKTVLQLYSVHMSNQFGALIYTKKCHSFIVLHDIFLDLSHTHYGRFHHVD